MTQATLYDITQGCFNQGDLWNIRFVQNVFENREHRDYHKAKRGKFGLSAHCKYCEKEKYIATKDVQLARQREKYKDNPEFYREKSKKYNHDNKEKVAAKDSERHRKKRLDNHELALQKDAEYRTKNMESIRAYKQKYCDKNAEKLKADRQANYAENREAIIKHVSIWCKNNRNRSRIIKKRWAKNNPDKVVSTRLKRAKVKTKCIPLWAASEWDRFVVREICDLARIRTEITGYAWHVDHRVPLVSYKVCGLHCSDNLEAIPATVNLTKSNLYWEHMP